MIQLKDDDAVKYSFELAKILCEAQGERLFANANSANSLADFIETLQNRFTCKLDQSE